MNDTTEQCPHCHDDPPKGHTCPACGREAPLNDLSIVTPEEAQEVSGPQPTEYVARLAHTVATEPDRTRAAVAAELRTQAKRLKSYMCDAGQELDDRAASIEDGAPL